MGTPNSLGVSDQLGVGGTGISPQGSSGPAKGLADLQTLLRNLLASIWQPYASTGALTASLALNRSDGQVALRLSDYSLWTWEAASVAGASATVIVPTDVGAGAGRWVALATTPGAAVTLATLGIQSGSNLLVAGVSAAIAATITANSRIVATRKALNASTAAGGLSALTADRAIGAPGSFKITSVKPADGTTETGDASTVDWHIIG